MISIMLNNSNMIHYILDGQTGSGKTHTMVGIQNLISEDLFEQLNSDEYYINTQVRLMS